MPPRRFAECPACGHERLLRRPRQQRIEQGALLPPGFEWSCRLCQYSWTEPRFETADDWELV